MKNKYIAFFYISIVCLLLSAIIHFISLAGIYIDLLFTFTWVLHLGIFVVMIPAIIVQNKDPELKKKMWPHKLFKALYKDKPPILKYLAIPIFLYAIVNFFLFQIAGEGGAPEIEGGKYILAHRGDFIKELSEAEYYLHKANILRGFSGHWILFYFFGMSILWPKKKII